MSTHLKLLALASAAMLVLPAIGQAASLDLVENSLGGWTMSGSNFASFSIDSTAVGTPASFVSTTYSPISTIAIAATWSDTTDTSLSDGTGKELVVVSATNPTVVSEMVGTESFTGTLGEFTGDFYVGNPPDSSSVGAHNVYGIIDQGQVESFYIAQDGSTLTIDTSAIPEPGSLALLGTGLLGLGAAFRRRMRRTAPPKADR